MSYRIDCKRTADGYEPNGLVVRLSDDLYIPINSDVEASREYQKWVAEGNTPEPFQPPTE